MVSTVIDTAEISCTFICVASMLIDSIFIIFAFITSIVFTLISLTKPSAPPAPATVKIEPADGKVPSEF